MKPFIKGEQSMTKPLIYKQSFKPTDLDSNGYLTVIHNLGVKVQVVCIYDDQGNLLASPFPPVTPEDLIEDKGEFTTIESTTSTVKFRPAIISGTVVLIA